MVEPGRRCLADRYELGQLIAAGGMGQVWRGTDVLLGRPVAVKVLRSEYTGDPTFLARFRAEAQHAASLCHPNIARVFDYGEVVAEDGTGETLAYLVMELVEGQPLSAVLREDGPLSPATTLSLLRQAGLALAEAHRVGMVHRDVKPGNILVLPDGSVKITDFGIAWSAAERAADPHRPGDRDPAVPLARAGRGPAGLARPATSTPWAWSATSAWPGTPPSTATTPSPSRSSSCASSPSRCPAELPAACGPSSTTRWSRTPTAGWPTARRSWPPSTPRPPGARCPSCRRRLRRSPPRHLVRRRTRTRPARCGCRRRAGRGRGAALSCSCPWSRSSSAQAWPPWC